MRILITGGAGFVGCNLADYFLTKDHEVIIFDNLSRAGTEKNLEWLTSNHRKRLSIIKADIRDFNPLKSAMKDVDVILHTAAQVAVTTSLKNPMGDFEINASGTLNVLEAARLANTTPTIIYFSCYDEKTRAVTKEGLKRFDELKIGDIVLSINTKTGEIEEKPIKDIIIQFYSGPMIHFKDKGVDLCVTPNHRMLVQKRNGIFLMRADRILEEKQRRKIPKGIWNGFTQAYISLEQKNLSWNTKRINDTIPINDFLYLIGLYIGDGTCEMPSKTGLNRKECSIKCRDTKTGRFISIKGNCGTTKCTSHLIFFHIPKEDARRHKLEEVLSRNGIKYHAAKSTAHGEWGVYFSSVALFNFFKECGTKATEKRIPQWMLKLDKQSLRYLFAGLIDSDGHWGECPTFTTSSIGLMRDMIELGIKIGYNVYIYEDKIKTVIENRTVEGNCYRLAFTETSRTLPTGNTKVIPYRGIIWCVEVEDNENLLVERNGKIAFSGNTNKVYGNNVNKIPLIEKETRYEFADKKYKFGIPEDFPTDANEHTPYGVSKYAADLYMRDYFAVFGLPTVTFRCSCVYGMRQFGNEDQGYLAHFVISTLLEKPLTIYGTGKQVRDNLFITDLLKAVDLILKNINKVKGEVFNIGGGPNNTSSLLELVDLLEKMTGKRSKITFSDWRPFDQLVYISDIRKAEKLLNWKPLVKPEDGVKKLIDWVEENKELFSS